MKNIDQMLKEELKPDFEPDNYLNVNIINQAKELKKMKRKTFKPSVIAATLILILALGSVGVFAAVHFLSVSEVAKIATESKDLEKAFVSSDSAYINETVHTSGYDVTLLGTAAGENLMPAFSESKDASSIFKSKTYAVIAINKDDGSKMPKVSSNDYHTFCISPLINGVDWKTVNNGTLNAGIISFVMDGVQYELLECDGLEIFAERGVQLGVLKDFGEETKAFSYNEKTEQYELNFEYKDFAALFTLPIDKSKADEETVEKYVEESENNMNSDVNNEDNENNYSSNKEVDEWMSGMMKAGTSDSDKWKFVLKNAKPVNSSKQIISGDKDGFLEVYSEDGAYVSLEAGDWEFEPGVTVITGCRSDDTMSGTKAESFTLNEDGTFTYLEYVPTK